MKRCLLMLACAWAVAACSASRFDRLFDAGAYQAAVEAFAADSSLHGDEDALFRAALAQATAGQPAYDPSAARGLLEQLLQRFPNSAYRHQATALVSTLRNAEQLARESARVEQELGALRTRVVALEQRVAVQEALHDELATGALALRDTLEQVQLRLRVREGQLRELQDELRGLKRIDLGPIVRDTIPGTP